MAEYFRLMRSIGGVVNHFLKCKRQIVFFSRKNSLILFVSVRERNIPELIWLNEYLDEGDCKSELLIQITRLKRVIDIGLGECLGNQKHDEFLLLRKTINYSVFYSFDSQTFLPNSWCCNELVNPNLSELKHGEKRAIFQFIQVWICLLVAGSSHWSPPPPNNLSQNYCKQIIFLWLNLFAKSGFLITLLVYYSTIALPTVRPS